MCLAINLNETENYRWENRNNKCVTVWKVVCNTKATREINKRFRTNYKYHTICMETGFDKKLKASSKVEIEHTDRLEGGAIHCFSSRNKAKNCCWDSSKIIKCKAKMSDFLYASHIDAGELCFKEIEVV